MFEQEAKLHSKEWFSNNIDTSTYETPFTERYCYELGFKDSAEFGYNKANEWHYHGVPHDNKPYLCKVIHPKNSEMTDLEILFYDEKDMTWFRWLTLWSGKEGNEIARINRKVIAWKEITFTEEDKMEYRRQVNYSDDILKIKTKDKALTKKIKKFKKLYNEILQLQDIKNTYGCNMTILLECSNIPNLKEHGNDFSSCKETCKDRESCDCYRRIREVR